MWKKKQQSQEKEEKQKQKQAKDKDPRVESSLTERFTEQCTDSVSAAVETVDSAASINARCAAMLCRAWSESRVVCTFVLITLCLER